MGGVAEMYPEQELAGKISLGVIFPVYFAVGRMLQASSQ